MKKAFVLSCAAFLLLAAIGCREYYQMQGLHKVKAQYDPDGKKMVIIPFNDPISDYFESPEGRTITEHAGDYISGHDIAPVVYEEPFPTGARAAYDEHKADLLMALKAVADATESDLVLIGQIISIHDGKPEDVGIVKGWMFVSARLYDMKEGARPVWHIRSKKIVYPEGLAYEAGFPETDLPRAELRQAMLVKAGETIGKAFHTHLEQIK